jgi:hypothetical protein
MAKIIMPLAEKPGEKPGHPQLLRVKVVGVLAFSPKKSRPAGRPKHRVVLAREIVQ